MWACLSVSQHQQYTSYLNSFCSFVLSVCGFYIFKWETGWIGIASQYPYWHNIPVYKVQYFTIRPKDKKLFKFHQDWSWSNISRSHFKASCEMKKILMKVICYLADHDWCLKTVVEIAQSKECNDKDSVPCCLVMMKIGINLLYLLIVRQGILISIILILIITDLNSNMYLAMTNPTNPT